MSNTPISIVSELNRGEYAALAKPYSAKRLRLTLAPTVVVAITMLVPTILFGGIMVFADLNAPPGPIARHITNVLFTHLWPIFLAVQALYLMMASVRMWAVLNRRRTQVRVLFPDRLRREAVTTQITPYGIVQSSAGSSIITPWGNVIRMDEIPEAFVLQTKNWNAASWPAWIDLTYIPKPRDPSMAPEISIDLLQQFRDGSATSPNYLWHADLVSSSNRTAAPETVWPPPPDVPESNVNVGIPLTGNIYLPMLQAASDGIKLSFKYGPALKMQQAQSTLVMPVILFVDFYRYLSGVQLYWGIAAAVALSAVSYAIVWYSRPLIVIDRQKSQMILKGMRFAATSEIQAITVTDSPAIFINRPLRKPAYITVSKTTGKSQRLPILAYSSASETNIVAMILGQFLTETKQPPQT